MTFLSHYISRWWLQTWDTCIYFTVVSQSEARVSTKHGIDMDIIYYISLYSLYISIELGQVYIVDPFHQRVYKHIIQISWKIYVDQARQIMIRSGHNFAHDMTCVKLWPHWIINITIRALHFSHGQDFNYESIKPLWNDPLPKVINSECHILGSVALIIVSCQPSVCFHRFMNERFGENQLCIKKTYRN